MENGQYFLNGEKFYSTGTSFADWIAIRALHPDGYTVLAIVDRHAVGVEVINDWNGFGQRTTASGTVKLRNVVVDPALFLMSALLLILQMFAVPILSFYKLPLMLASPKQLLMTLYPAFVKHAPLLMQV